VATAIRDMTIRGAPAIGVAAAMGVALGVLHASETDLDARTLDTQMEEICATLAATRPTAVNLFWGDRPDETGVRKRGRPADRGDPPAPGGRSAAGARGRYCDLPRHRPQWSGAGAGSENRAHPLQTPVALATAGYGTALGVIRAAVEAGKQIDVFADETRPFLQGARLTVWELQQDGIPTTLITDNMAGHFLKSGRIGCVVVGADRIAANGDVANKVGTYSVAVLAKENGVPFFVAAPISTLDLSLASGGAIPSNSAPPRK